MDDGRIFCPIFDPVHLFHPGKAGGARVSEGTVHHTCPLTGLCDVPPKERVMNATDPSITPAR